MKHLKLKLLAAHVALGLFANCAYADSTVTLSGLESGPTVHALIAKTPHTTQSTPDELIAAAARGNAIIMLSVLTTHDVERAKPIIRAAMDKRIDVLIEGSDELITQLKPVNQSIWVPGNRLFISTRSDSLGTYLLTFDPKATVDQINTQLTQTRAQIAKDVLQNQPLSVKATPRSGSGKSNVSGTFDMPDLVAPTPSSVCLSLRNELASQVSDPNIPESEITRSVQRVCQYGTIGEFRAVPAEVGLDGKDPSPYLYLNLRKEWMLLLSEDKTQPDGSRAYLWLRTLGDDGGSGFTWKNGVGGHAFADKKGATMYYIMHPSIHSGWGPVETRPGQWPHHSPADMFRCESDPNARDGSAHSADSVTTTAYCPVHPRLLSVLPGNSYDDNVTVATSTGWSIGAGFSGAMSDRKPTLSLSLSGGYSRTNTAEATLSMVRTSTNANTLMYRTTTWSPSWEAMGKWIEAKNLKKETYIDLGAATPLASTLNPAWSIVWQLPLQENAGRTTMYTSAYDARDRWCQWDNKRGRCENDTTGIGGAWISNSSLFVTIPPTP